MRRRCRASRSASSAFHVSREVSKLLPAYLYRPFSKRLRWGDYTRGAAANQLDDGIGDTFVLGPVEQSSPESVFISRSKTAAHPAHSIPHNRQSVELSLRAKCRINRVKQSRVAERLEQALHRTLFE